MTSPVETVRRWLEESKDSVVVLSASELTSLLQQLQAQQRHHQLALGLLEKSLDQHRNSQSHQQPFD